MKYFLSILMATVFFCTVQAQQKTVVSEKKMVTVRGGNYKPFFISKSSRPVYVTSFRMDETPVTNAEYLIFVKSNPRWRRSKVNRLFADTNYLRHWKNDLEIGVSNKIIYNSPVVNVSWFAAQAYCKWKNKQLPTVAQWELAANGSPKDFKYKSLTDFILDWYTKPSPRVLPHVKSTYQNQYGLYDMHGLIWEWTFNFNSFAASPDSRRNGEDDFKNFCAGGAINVADKTDYAAYLRYGYRASLKGNYCISSLGFRCVKN